MDWQNILARREFLKQAGLAAAAACACGCGHLSALGGPRAARIRPGQIPDPVPGRLKMKIPDEEMIRGVANMHPFDLHARMNLAVSAMTCCTDPMLGYISYSQVHYETKPPHMLHTVGDFIDDMGRHTDAMWLIRSATGTKLNDEVVLKMAQNAMDIVENGYAWNPNEPPFTWGSAADKPKEMWTHMPEATRIILGMSSYYRATGDPRALSTAREMTHGLHRIAAKDDKYFWFSDMNCVRSGGNAIPYSEKTVPRENQHAAAMMGLFLLPVLRYYEETQDPLAEELATRFIDMVIDLIPDFAKNIGQTHSCLATTSGVFKAGHLFNKPHYMQWAQVVHDAALASGWVTDYGWVPENTARERKPDFLCSEVCSVTDLLELSLARAAAGEEHMWDVAERIATNQLFEAQYMNYDALSNYPNAGAPPSSDPRWFTTDDVVARSLGGFPSFAGPNDNLQSSFPFAVQCCFGSGARGLYDTWYYTAQEDAGTVRVNMMLSKSLPSAAITSFMPGRAALKIKMTREAKLQVRKPQWAERGETKLLVNGNSRTVGMQGTYFDFGGLPSGTEVSIEFPNDVTEKNEALGEVKFTTKWRGNAVLSIDPAGTISPFYRHRDRTDGVEPPKYVSQKPIASI